MKFSNLTLNGWRQFENVQIEFHPRITVITGANGAGKSTLLGILSKHYGWGQPLLATPSYTKEGGLRYFTGLFDWLKAKEESPQHAVGNIKYSSGDIAQITVPPGESIQYQIQIKNARPVEGLHISSHRPVPTYQQVGSIPTNAIGAEQAFQTYFQETMSRYQNAYSQFGPTYRMKEAIISMATFGPGNEYVQRNENVAKLFVDFKDVLSKILPSSIGFRDINIRIPDVVVVTDTGDFVIDAASGGLMSIIDLAWQIFLYSHGKTEFVVTIDEPENHLHPSMQRSLLGKLLAAFPRAQFIIATHSPFLVSSVKDSSVYVLGYNPSQQREAGIGSRVSSLKLDKANKAGTASEILRDVLGVPVTLPEWAEQELKAIANDFQIAKINSEQIGQLRRRLDDAGLGEYYPEALRQIAQ